MGTDTSATTPAAVSNVRDVTRIPLAELARQAHAVQHRASGAGEFNSSI